MVENRQVEIRTFGRGDTTDGHTTNPLKMKQRTFYNVFENGPRVAGANADATAANFKASNGFPTSFEVCQPRGRRMLNRARGKQLTRKRCSPTENLQIL